MSIKISKSWSCVKTFDELISDSKFIFSVGNGSRPRIVLNTPIDGYDCIEIDYMRDGLITNGVNKFQSPWGLMIEDSSKMCVEFIKDFLIKDGANDLILIPPDRE